MTVIDSNEFINQLLFVNYRCNHGENAGVLCICMTLDEVY